MIYQRIATLIAEAKKGKKVNPWAVCTASTGRKDKDKYERCVMDVKKKHGVKEEKASDDFVKNATDEEWRAYMAKKTAKAQAIKKAQAEKAKNTLPHPTRRGETWDEVYDPRDYKK